MEKIKQIGFYGIIFIFFLILTSANSDASDVDIENEQVCIPTYDNLNFNIHYKPELNSIYIATYNPFEKDIQNISFGLLIYNEDTNKIVDKIKFTPRNISSGSFSCELFGDINIPYNSNLKTMFWQLKYKYGDEERNFYSSPIENTFRINKCLEFNKWTREKQLNFDGGSDVKDTIVFKKLCNKTLYLNLKFDDIEVAHISVNKAQLINEDRPLEVFSPSNSNMIKIEIPEDLEEERLFNLNVDYHLPKTKKSQNTIYLLYPFIGRSSVTDVTLGEVYITSTDDYYEKVSDINLYTIYLSLPKGLSIPSKPLELGHDKQLDMLLLKDGGDDISIFYPNLGCVAPEKTEFPISCLKSIPVLTPKEDKSTGRLLWSTEIINGQPEKLSFSVNADILFIFFYIAFLIISLILIILIDKKGFLIAILTYSSVYLLIRLALPIPFIITLFDLTYIFFIIISTAIYLIKKYKSNLKSAFDFIVAKIKYYLELSKSKLKNLYKKMEIFIKEYLNKKKKKESEK